MGENEQGGILRVVVVVGLIAIIAVTVIFAVTGLKNTASTHREDVVTQIDTARTQGQNLLRGTKDFSNGEWPWVGFWKAPETYKGMTVSQTNGQWGGPKYAINDLRLRGVINENDTYVWSAWMKNTSGTSVPIGFFARNGGTAYASEESYIAATLAPHSDWQRLVSRPFKFKNLDDASLWTVRFESTIAIPDGQVYWAGLKLEQGDKATGYSPAVGE